MKQKIVFIIFICCCFVELSTANESKVTLLNKFDLNEPKIYNGKDADWKDGTRYQVSIRLKSKDWFFGAGHICGGSLIAPDVVLTAAHCILNYDLNVFRQPEEFSAVVGNLNRFQNDNNTLIFNITKISMLKSFNVTTFQDDVALMFLDSEVHKNYTRASVIALNDVRNLTTVSDKCEISGWGEMETGQYPSNLRVVDVNLLNDTYCRSRYGAYILNGMICAGFVEGVKDSCAGDSGGPLNCGGKLVGVVSFGSKCGLAGAPGVYADVAFYADWIRKEAGINSSYSLRPLTLFIFLFIQIFNLL